MPRSKKSDTNEHLANALAGIDADIRALQTKRAQLVAIMGGESSIPAAQPKAKAAKKATGGGKKKRIMTDEAKQKISAAQKARWEAAKKKK